MTNVFRKLGAILDRAEKREVAILLVLMLVGMILETLGVGLVVPVLALITDPAMVSRYPATERLVAIVGNPEPMMLVGGAMALLVLAYAVKVAFLAFLAWKQARFIFGLDAALSERLFRGYLLQPYTFHLQRNSALLIRNVTGEIAQFTTGVSAACLLVTESLVLFGLATLLLMAEPVGAVVVVVTLGLSGVAFYTLARRKILHWGEARQFHEVQRLQRLQQGLSGVKDVKVLGRESEFVAEYSLHLGAATRIGRHLNLLQALPRLWLEFMAVTGLAVLVVTMLLQNKPAESLVPTLGLFAAAAFRLMPSVSRFLGGLQTLRFNLPVIDTLYREREFLRADAADVAARPLVFERTIEFNNVIFSYPDTDAPQIDGLSFAIGKGAVVGIVGGSGAGKSTVIDLLLGLLNPSAGAVLADGVDVRENLRAWQSQIGYVPQSIYLTDDSIRRNVAFGVSPDEISGARVREALAAAQLMEFVSSLPEGLETIVGERGVRLSGGQRQRIGIARALYHNPELLVLDEASSALDTQTEQDVMQAVLSLRGSRTIVIVAHRLSTVATCDAIYRLEQGRIVASGRPADVLGSDTGGNSGESMQQMNGVA